LRQILRRGHSKADPHLDDKLRGEIGRKEAWLSKFSKSKQDWVRRLESQPSEFLDSLDALIPLAGQWPAVLVGVFPRLFTLHCPEVGGSPESLAPAGEV
jgi:hypothetical protein